MMSTKIDNHLVDFYKNADTIISIWYQYNNNILQTHFLYDLKEHKFFAYDGLNFLTKRQTKILEKKILKFYGSDTDEN